MTLGPVGKLTQADSMAVNNGRDNRRDFDILNILYLVIFIVQAGEDLRASSRRDIV
ncbi:MAG: hypothetical protein NMNS02_04720 [Nitrosomonas sp.]|nr:MAG: hypothetical protein NMNS02_04720 [Nitrosomonas sp.]